MNEHRNNAHNLEAALKELEELRPDVAKAFLSNHDLPEKKPFDKTKMVSDAALWTELQSLIAHFKEFPKAPITSMKGRGTYEQYIPMTFEELMSLDENSGSIVKVLLKEVGSPNDLTLAMDNYIFQLFARTEKNKEVAEYITAALNGLAKGLKKQFKETKSNNLSAMALAIDSVVTKINSWFK